MISWDPWTNWIFLLATEELLSEKFAVKGDHNTIQILCIDDVKSPMNGNRSQVAYLLKYVDIITAYNPSTKLVSISKRSSQFCYAYSIVARA